jgi:sucrose-6-phosphate hydrolase SacC (GH32 family)
MSIPRSLSLRKTDNGYVMVQKPVTELNSLRGPRHQLDSVTLRNSVAVQNPVTDSDTPAPGRSYELQLKLTPAAARSGIRIHASDKQFTEIGYNSSTNSVYVDRTRSGNTQFDGRFPGIHSAPAQPVDGAITLQIFVDRSTVEVFINNGEAVISDRIFPSETSTGLHFFADDGSAEFTDVTLWPLKSVWKD